MRVGSAIGSAPCLDAAEAAAKAAADKFAAEKAASDMDCAGGNGNGPAYVQGPVTFVGTEIYRLDGSDNDGIGCEG